MIERLSRIGMVVILLALVGAQSAFPLSSYDEWWHLATGRYILEHRTVPTVDVFSFTAAGRPWVTHEWLFEVVAWLAWSLGGSTLLILLKVALVCGTALLCWLNLRRLGVRTWLAGLLIAVASYLLTFRAFVRPHVLSEFLLALMLFVYLGWRLDPQRWRHRFRLLWLVPLVIVWANSHSAVVLGLILWGALVFGELAAKLLERRQPSAPGSAMAWPEIGFAGLVGAVLLVVSLLNPNGVRALSYPLLIVRSRLFVGSIMELQSPLEAAFAGSDFVVALLALAVIAVGSFAVARRFSTVRILVVLLFGGLAAAAIRNIPPFAVVALPFVGANLEAALGERLRGRTRLPLTWAAGVFAAGLAAVVFGYGVRIAGQPRRPGLGVEERLFPVRAAAFVANSPVRGEVFNTMEFGGYLIWRWYERRQVFIDGRLDVYGEEVFEDYLQVLWTGERCRSILESTGVNWLVVAQPPDLSGRTSRYIGRQAGMDTTWALVQWDDVSLTYLRRAAAEPGYLASLEYIELKPYLLGTGAPVRQNRARLLDEAQRAFASAPNSASTLNLLGQALLANDRPDSAIAVFTSALRTRPEHSLSLQGLAMARLQTGRVPDAVALLDRVVRREPDNGLALYNLGYARLQQADYGRAAELFERALRLDPNMVVALNMLGEVRLRQGRTAEARESWLAAVRVEPGNAFALQRLARLGGSTGAPGSGP